MLHEPGEPDLPSNERFESVVKQAVRRGQRGQQPDVQVEREVLDLDAESAETDCDDAAIVASAPAA